MQEMSYILQAYCAYGFAHVICGKWELLNNVTKRRKSGGNLSYKIFTCHLGDSHSLINTL